MLTYLTTTGTWLANIVPDPRLSETTLFPGALALGLALLAVAWIRADRAARAPRGWPERLVSAVMVASLRPRSADGHAVTGG